MSRFDIRAFVVRVPRSFLIRFTFAVTKNAKTQTLDMIREADELSRELLKEKELYEVSTILEADHDWQSLPTSFSSHSVAGNRFRLRSDEG
jgi:hypothetical protein